MLSQRDHENSSNEQDRVADKSRILYLEAKLADMQFRPQVDEAANRLRQELDGMAETI